MRVDKGVVIGILAAGISKRLGRPKQLEIFADKTLLQNTIEEASSSISDNILVVTGYKNDEIEASISQYNVSFVFNPDFETGIASSIKKVIEYARKENFEAAIISVCDQPFLNVEIFDQLITVGREKNSLVLSRYNGGSGVPVYVPNQFYDIFLQLEGDNGAGSILKKQKHELIDFPKGDIDIDSEGDLKFN